MKIAHIVPIFPPDKGGMGNAAFHMADEAARGGNEVTIFTPLYGSGPVREVTDKIRVVRLRSILRHGKAAFVPQLFFLLRDFDVLHLHYPFFGGTEAVWLFKKLHKKTKLIISYHMDVVGTGFKAAVFKAYTRLLLRRVISSADKVIVSSYDYAEHSYINPIVGREKIAEIPFGTHSRFSPGGKKESLLRQWGFSSEEVIILFVGSFEYFKGIDCLLKSIPYLTGNFSLLFVGEGELLPGYRRLGEELGISDRVRFVGSASDQELVDYYNLSDIFVLPSTDRTEAFGMVLIEAMACGKPVIASNLPGLRTVVDHGRNGYLTRPGDIRDIAEKIQILIDRGDLRTEFGRRSREKVLKQYLWEEVGSRLNRLYQGLVLS